MIGTLKNIVTMNKKIVEKLAEMNGPRVKMEPADPGKLTRSQRRKVNKRKANELVVVEVNGKKGCWSRI